MATIALYARQVNQMPELVRGIKSAVNDYKTELLSLQMKVYGIGTSACNLDDVVASIQSSTKTQEEKVTSFDALEKETEEFIENAVSVDRDVADVINKQRNEFYEKYAYLKPECEKSGWDKFCEGVKSVGEWCREHLQSILFIIGAVAIIGALIFSCIRTFGAPAVIAATFVGGFANIAGQFIGDCTTSIALKKWSPSSVEAYIGAFIGGAVGGITTLLTRGHPVIVSSASASVSTFITGHLENITGREKKTSLEILHESGTYALWAGIIAKVFPVNIKGVTKGRNNFDAVFKGVLTKLKKGSARRFSFKTIAKGVVASISGDLVLTGINSLDTIIRRKWESHIKNFKRSVLLYE